MENDNQKDNTQVKKAMEESISKVPGFWRWYFPRKPIFFKVHFFSYFIQ